MYTEQQLRAESNCTRFTLGGDCINYPDDCRIPVADMLVVKILLNSIISTKGETFITMDISNFLHQHSFEASQVDQSMHQ